MKVIHIVPNLYVHLSGIWGAAISTAHILKQEYDIQSEVWCLRKNISCSLPKTVQLRPLNTGSYAEVSELVGLIDPKEVVINSHSSWGKPTEIARRLARVGFKWIYHPHGTLEPWSLGKGAIKKRIYYSLKEGPLTRKADVVRAVSMPERENLSRFYKNIVLIPNGVEIPAYIQRKDWDKLRFIFMSRLHFKKGVFELIKGWIQSSLNNAENVELLIAGPDEGELDRLGPLVRQSSNIQILGSVFGEKKEQLLNSGHFIVLPSHSEGFPTAVLEGMGYGLIPVISKGCNFPEVFEENLGFEVLPDAGQIEKQLEQIVDLDYATLISKAVASRKKVEKNYILRSIAESQYLLYENLLENRI